MNVLMLRFSQFLCAKRRQLPKYFALCDSLRSYTSTTCGETGLNIPQANVVIIADTSWTPSRQIQAYSRVLRPQQKKKLRIYLLRAKGTIDEYMQQLMNAKSEAIDEGIDYQDSLEFDPAKWLSYRDFTLKMLKEEGYEMG